MDERTSESSVKYKEVEADDLIIDGFEITDVKRGKRINKGCVIWSLIAACTLVVVLLIIVIVLASLLGVEVNRRKAAAASAQQGMCLTSACVQASAQVAAGLNESVDPCDDFYQFACGSWIKDNIIAQGEGQYTILGNTLGDKNNVVLRKILEEEDDGGVAAVRKAIDFYKSCIDTTTIDSWGAEPIQNLIDDLGVWNFDEESPTRSLVSTPRLFQEKLRGSDAYFTIGVAPDRKNSSAHIFYLTQSGISLSATSYNDTNQITQLNSTIKKVLQLIQPDISEEEAENVASKIVNVEIQLSTIFVSQLELQDVVKTYNQFAVNELYELWPEFDWLTYFQELATFAGIDHINRSEPIIVQTPSYFRNLSKVLNSSDISYTDLDNYARWRFIQAYLPYLSKDFRTLLGQSDSDRTSTCMQYTQQAFPFALARPFVKSVFRNNLKSSVSEIATSIKEAFKEQLKQLDWLDVFSRQACMDKVDAILEQVAYPNEIFNDSYLDDLYADYNITLNDFFDNGYRILRTTLESQLSKLRKPVQRGRWPTEASPITTNAYYSPNQNQFVFLAGILRTPVFSADWPNYLKYGGFGSIAGHELTHGFDNTGQMFDKNGNLRQWWSNQSIQEFKQREKCFVNQYSNYSLLGSQVNGQLTLGENIADNGGLRAAFKAYQNTKTSGATPQRLPSLTYTDDQLFFISFGQLWCSLYTPVGIQSLTLSDEHSPGPIRVLGTLQNSEDFARVFNCPKGSKMNPQAHKKCILW